MTVRLPIRSLVALTAAIGIVATVATIGMTAVTESDTGGRESHRLDEQLARGRTLMASQDAVAADLAAGRIGLADAVDAAERLYEAAPELTESVRSTYPGETLRESLARQAVARALGATADPDDWADLAVRLAGEFDALFPGAAPEPKSGPRGSGLR